MDDNKFDRIMEKLESQGEDLITIKTILLPPNEKPVISSLEERMGKLESWRSYIAGAVGALMALFGLHASISKH